MKKQLFGLLPIVFLGSSILFADAQTKKDEADDVQQHSPHLDDQEQVDLNKKRFFFFNTDAVTDAENIGGGLGEIFASKSGDTLQFRTLTSPMSTVQIAVDGDTVTLEACFPGSCISSAKYKTDITVLEEESILADVVSRLVPVSFRFKKEIDEKQRLQYGFIAEDVADVDPALVTYKDGEPEAVNYQMISVLLVSQVQDLKKRIAHLEKRRECRCVGTKQMQEVQDAK